ncbi:3-dehydroquinate synthase [Shewanella surugensis]|uniref:3-dehydroquinate synthase n=1 Tax=Shewanella surugensis TaxID=212020 RepID=A0ABT0LGR4_9GAMM|nr:3-dehydroquinate synthase [Shewanella surugensis]MCL1126896.1 3-dehydroquinate synthase [Shewanella surugensis]
MTRFRPILGIMLLIMVFVIISFFSFEQMITNVIKDSIELFSDAELKAVWIAFLVIGLLMLDIILPIPSSLVAVYVGTVFGVFSGTVIIWIGLTLGAILGYGLGRGFYTLFPDYWGIKGHLNKASILSETLDDAALVLMRGIPVMAETSVIAAGIIQLSFVRFIMLISLANAGVALVYAYVGSLIIESYSLLMILVASIILPSLAFGIKYIIDVFIRYKKVNEPTENHQLSLTTPAKEFESDNSNIKVELPFRENSNRLDNLSVQFQINYDYQVSSTENSFAINNSLLMDLVRHPVFSHEQKVLCIIDQGIIDSRPYFTQKIEDYFNHHFSSTFSCQTKVMQGGEACKTQTQLDMIIESMKPLDRHSWVIAIGGGALLDCVGFACAIFHRGIRLIRMPSTVLAQNDAGIGVKNGINVFQQKNFLGSFTPPYAVINDAELLTSLLDRDKRSGLAEAVKVALIKDPVFFTWLEENVESLNQFELTATRYAIQRCAQCHLEHISHNGDPFERGNGRPLDYGHWSAHKMENLSDYQIRHGEAVAIGIVLDALYAQEMAWLNTENIHRIIKLIKSLGFELWHHSLEMEDDKAEPLVMQGLEEFRQHLGGKLSIPILTNVGTFRNAEMIDINKMKAALTQLKHWSMALSL